MSSCAEELIARGARFRTESDTEVILAAYDALGRRTASSDFNGDFAFALWDRRAPPLDARARPHGRPPALLYAGSAAASISLPR